MAVQRTGALATAHYHILALLAREDDKMPIVRPAFHLLAFRQPLLYMDYTSWTTYLLAYIFHTATANLYFFYFIGVEPSEETCIIVMYGFFIGLQTKIVKTQSQHALLIHIL